MIAAAGGNERDERADPGAGRGQPRTRGAAQERRDGVRAMAPMLVALVPFAVVVGTAVAQSDHRLAAWLGTSTIYGGAAHLAVLDLRRRERVGGRGRRRAPDQRAPRRVRDVHGPRVAVRPVAAATGRRRDADRHPLGAVPGTPRPAAVLPRRRTHPVPGVAGHGHRRDAARRRGWPSCPSPRSCPRSRSARSS